MEPVITTQRLTKSFGESLAVDELSLTIEQGEIFGFLGHNGAGKTTTIRLLNGILLPSSGESRVLGMDPTTDGAKVRAQTGVLTETPALDDRLTARATLHYFAQMYGMSRAVVDRRVDELLDRFGMLDRADDKIGSYSKGMRQRVALMRTLIHSPQIVFLDEPTAGLDPVAAREVHKMIRGLRQQQHTVFLCSHNLIEAERLCDRVAVLSQGRILALGSTQDLAAQLAHGHRLLVEVRRADAPRALQILQSSPLVTGAASTDHSGADNGDSVQLSVQGIGRDAIPAVVALLVQKEIGIYRLAPDEPSLEDVYFALEHR